MTEASFSTKKFTASDGHTFERSTALSDLDKLTAIDLFAGAGGLTQGLKDAGFRVISAVELDELAVKSYQANHPEVKVWHTDIRCLHPRHFKRSRKLRTGELDLLAGCPPCQGFSQVRTLRGKRFVEDINNDLLFRFLAFVKELKPKAVMMENVPGLAEDDRMKRFLEVLRSLGYHVDEHVVKVLDAADYGVPQRRRRMILLAGRMGGINFAVPDQEQLAIKHVLRNLPEAGKSGDPLHDTLTIHTPEVLDRIKKIPKDGGSRLALGPENQLECHKNLKGFTDIYGRMAWDRPAPTITGGCIAPSKGRFLHPEYDRGITLREAALLQSFPSNYYFALDRGKFAAAQMIGNALPPEFIRRHALQIKAYLHEHCGRRFSTDITSSQWNCVAQVLCIDQNASSREKAATLRDVINALRYSESASQEFGSLPSLFPHASTLQCYYHAWTTNGLWEHIQAILHATTCLTDGVDSSSEAHEH